MLWETNGEITSLTSVLKSIQTDIFFKNYFPKELNHVEIYR